MLSQETCLTCWNYVCRRLLIRCRKAVGFYFKQQNIFFDVGGIIGTIVSLFMSGYLCEYVGWESLFYVYGKNNKAHDTEEMLLFDECSSIPIGVYKIHFYS